MEANDFLAKIKANGNDKEWSDLAKVYNEYKKVSSKLPSKDRGCFALNLLCLLCRNLEKLPSWKDSVNTKDLLILSIDCIRETRALNKAEQGKILACIYHIHSYAVRKSISVPPELILKISFMAFESDPKNFVKEYCKVYWSILLDSLTYLEKLKGKSLHKLIPTLTENIFIIIDIYDTKQFCVHVLVPLIKRLHTVFSDGNSEQLNKLYEDIFNKISHKTDLEEFKKLNDAGILDLYIKLSECFYVIVENAAKNNFKDSTLITSVRTAILLLGHRTDMFHCLQTFYLNSFCDLLGSKTVYIDNLFKNLIVSCDMTVKLGYKDTMLATYAFLSQLLRVYMEYSVTNSIIDNFAVEIQVNCLKFMLKILSMLKFSRQQTKCDSTCTVKTGLHDALRLSFVVKDYITISLQNEIDISTIIYLYNEIMQAQYNITNELKQLKCTNWKRLFEKLQINSHNTAIFLNSYKQYEFSINLLEIFIKNELNIKDMRQPNVSRAFYNKSICELDFKKYEIALLDAYLALAFSSDLNSDKYMSLVMDIKDKSMKDESFDDDNDQLQLMSVMEACQMVINRKLYDDLESHLKDVKFSCLLKHEFSKYVKLWSSSMLIAGVWKSLHQLLGDIEEWMTVENEDIILGTLLEVMSMTPSAVKTIDNDYYKDIVRSVLERIDKIPDPVAVDIKVVQTILLFLKAEYDIAEAKEKYGWKINMNPEDPDQIQQRRTIEQEHNALQSALQAFELWTELYMEINTVSKGPCLHAAVQMADMFVQQFLYFNKMAYGLQLAEICCLASQYTEQKSIYIRNVGVLAYHIDTPNVLEDKIDLTTELWADVVNSNDGIETGVIFLCDLAIYYFKCGSIRMAVDLVQLAQAKILETYDRTTNINLDLAVGRLMEAQTMICKYPGITTMSLLNVLQRHYLFVVNNGGTWLSRRIRAATMKYHASVYSMPCSRYARALALVRRARAACSCSAGVLAAATLARTTTYTVDVNSMQHAQVTIDNLKYIIGISAERPTAIDKPKVELFAPKQELEVMLECQPSKALSPTHKYVQIPGFQTPNFLKHNNCDCYACNNINCTIISYIIGGLEASIYFRGNEMEISRNYYDGVLKSLDYFDRKLKFIINKYTDMDFAKYVVDYVKKIHVDDFRLVKLDILIEQAYFELKNRNFDEADDILINIHEIIQDIKIIDAYISNEVMNLTIASAKMRNVVKKTEFNLEDEFENLKLSPNNELLKTPVSKPMMPVLTSKKASIKDEDIPKKRKVIKLNLDEESSDEKEEKPKQRKKPEFKLPGAVIQKPVLENMTPRKPITPATIEMRADTTLEVPTRSCRKLNKPKEALLRATSPGKLKDSVKTRPRRIRQPKLNDD